MQIQGLLTLHKDCVLRVLAHSKLDSGLELATDNHITALQLLAATMKRLKNGASAHAHGTLDQCHQLENALIVFASVSKHHLAVDVGMGPSKAQHWDFKTCTQRNWS